jgi:hypothetical protein
MRIMKRILALLVASIPTLTPLGAAELPVRAVTLSNAGLMQIERSGRLEAGETATLTIPTAQVDDVLKSLLVLDAAGSVLGISLPAQNLAEEAFRGLPLRPEDFADRLTMLRALRGQAVALGGAEGLLVDAAEAENGLSILILGERGMAQVPLREGDALRLTDAALAARVARAAAALAAARSAETRRAEIRFSANAAREVGLAYVAAAPLWKASFRLVLGEAEGRLQGWAVVENRSGADWEGVRLALVSGNPVAYAQALYTPITRARPEIPVRGAEVVRPRADTAPMPAPAPVIAPPGMPMLARSAIASAAPAPAPPPPAALPQSVAESSAGSVAFTLPNPVTLRASETANLPFLDSAMPAQRLWWLQGMGTRHPLNAARIRNSTDSTLPDGLVSIWAGSNFLGDAELRALNAGETRLLAFAQDRDVAITASQVATSRATRITTARALVLVEGEEDTVWSLAIAPRGATGALVVDMPRMPGWTPRFAVAAEGEFGLRHEARLEGRDATLRLPYARPVRIETPLWDAGMGDPASVTWRRITDNEMARLPGGPGTLERLSELLARTTPDTPGRAQLAEIVTAMAELRRLLDAASTAMRVWVVAEGALNRARTAADDRTGSDREEARRALNRASQASERAAAAADNAWKNWQDSVQALLARMG